MSGPSVVTPPGFAGASFTADLYGSYYYYHSLTPPDS